MKCKRCKERGAERMEVQYRNGSTVAVYLCRACAELERESDDVRDLAVSTPE